MLFGTLTPRRLSSATTGYSLTVIGSERVSCFNNRKSARKPQVRSKLASFVLHFLRSDTGIEPKRILGSPLRTP
jgi:hypothetical protein